MYNYSALFSAFCEKPGIFLRVFCQLYFLITEINRAGEKAHRARLNIPLGFLLVL